MSALTMNDLKGFWMSVTVTLVATCVGPTVASSDSLRAASITQGSSLSPGSFLLIIFFSGLTAYFAIGMAIRKFVGGATGREVVPNYDFWSDLPLLIKDGAKYTCSGFRSEVVYERI